MLKFYAQLFSVPHKYFCTSGCATNRGDAKSSGRMGKTDKIGKLVKKQVETTRKRKLMCFWRALPPVVINSLATIFWPNISRDGRNWNLITVRSGEPSLVVSRAQAKWQQQLFASLIDFALSWHYSATKKVNKIHLCNVLQRLNKSKQVWLLTFP